MNGARTFCRFRSNLFSCRKHKVNATQALRLLIEGKWPEFGKQFLIEGVEVLRNSFVVMVSIGIPDRLSGQQKTASVPGWSRTEKAPVRRLAQQRQKPNQEQDDELAPRHPSFSNAQRRTAASEPLSRQRPAVG
jgi:hypothetical protein